MGRLVNGELKKSGDLFVSHRYKACLSFTAGVAAIAALMYLTQVYSVTFDADSLRRNIASADTLAAVSANPFELSVVHNISRSHAHYHRISDYLKSTGLPVSHISSTGLGAKSLEKVAFGEQALVALISGRLKDTDGLAQIRRLFIGNDVLLARQRLRRFDAAFRLRVKQFLSTKPTIGFSGAHGEHAWTGEKTDTDLRRYEYVKESLRSSYMALVSVSKYLDQKTLHGLDAVISLGAQKGLFAHELAELERFMHQGGKWFLCMDSAQAMAGSPLAKWLAQQEIESMQYPVANESDYLSLSRSVRDRGFVMVQDYGSSPVTNVLRRQAALSASVFSSPSLFKPKKSGPKASIAAIPSKDSFADKNGNYSKDGTESFVPKDFGVLLSKNIGKGKFLLSGDCAWMQDFLMGSSGNRLLWAGVESWLFNPDIVSFGPETKDQYLVRSTKQAKSFLWLTTVLVPLCVLWLGFFNLVWFRKS